MEKTHKIILTCIVVIAIGVVAWLYFKKDESPATNTTKNLYSNDEDVTFVGQSQTSNIGVLKQYFNPNLTYSVAELKKVYKEKTTAPLAIELPSPAYSSEFMVKVSTDVNIKLFSAEQILMATISVPPKDESDKNELYVVSVEPQQIYIDNTSVFSMNEPQCLKYVLIESKYKKSFVLDKFEPRFEFRFNITETSDV